MLRAAATTAINRLNFRRKNDDEFFDALETPEQIHAYGAAQTQQRVRNAANRFRRAGATRGTARTLAKTGQTFMTPANRAQNLRERQAYQSRIAAMPPPTAATSGAVRARWGRAATVARDRRRMLIDAIASQYDVIDKLLRFKGSSVGQEVREVLLFYGSQMTSFARLRDMLAHKGATLYCKAPYVPLGANTYSTAKARADAFLTWMTTASCERLPATITGAASSAGTWAKQAAASLASRVPQGANPVYITVKMLPQLIAVVPAFAIRAAAGEYAKLLDVQALQSAVSRHRDALARVVTGNDVSLKPLVIDVARSINPCVVEAVLRAMNPSSQFKPPPISEVREQCML